MYVGELLEILKYKIQVSPPPVVNISPSASVVSIKMLAVVAGYHYLSMGGRPGLTGLSIILTPPTQHTWPASSRLINSHLDVRQRWKL